MPRDTFTPFIAALSAGAASEHLGMTPTEYRHGGKNVAIRYTIVDSPLGKMLIAATEQGLCSVAFGSLESELEDYLASRFPASDRK